MDGTPDLDRQETQEWLDALDGVLVREGPVRAHFLIEQLIERVRTGVEKVSGVRLELEVRVVGELQGAR